MVNFLPFPLHYNSMSLSKCVLLSRFVKEAKIPPQRAAMINTVLHVERL